MQKKKKKNLLSNTTLTHWWVSQEVILFPELDWGKVKIASFCILLSKLKTKNTSIELESTIVHNGNSNTSVPTGNSAKYLRLGQWNFLLKKKHQNECQNTQLIPFLLQISIFCDSHIISGISWALGWWLQLVHFAKLQFPSLKNT